MNAMSFGSAVLGAALAALAGGAVAQAYPAKPVRIIVGFAPGGGTDIMARVVAAKLTESMQQQFVVENRPGANASIAAKVAAEAAGDGYTVLFMSVSHIMSKPVYKVDLAKFTKVAQAANIRAD